MQVRTVSTKTCGRPRSASSCHSLCQYFLEWRLNILVLEGRNLKVSEALRLGPLSCNGIGHHAWPRLGLRPHDAANELVWGTILCELCMPIVKRLEGLSGRGVVNIQDAMDFLVELIPHFNEVRMPAHIPYVYSYILPLLLDDPATKVRAQGRLCALPELVIALAAKALRKSGFASANLPKQDHFDVGNFLVHWSHLMPVQRLSGGSHRPTQSALSALHLLRLGFTMLQP
mmetsp:Transcript_25692/g.59383  ORF Transcript_25692/g.59383 Transcript_25692/m.59383 type:complete len:230 (-) Transcript_25692:22-711(-)